MFLMIGFLVAVCGVWFNALFLFIFSWNPNRVLVVLMRRTTGGRHG